MPGAVQPATIAPPGRGDPPRANSPAGPAGGGRSVEIVTTTAPTDLPADRPGTVGELRASGHRLRGVRQELRDNLLTALRAGHDPWPGIVGFDTTVLPQLERALLAGHDVVLLGERGQGKTRLLRTWPLLLDEWTPVIEGSDLGEHPYEPITPASSPAGRRPRRRSAGRLAAPLRAVHREAGHPGHRGGRPDRRRRPGQGRRRAGRWATRRPSTSAWCRAPTAASWPSTSCPTWPNGSRCRC